MLFLRYSFVTVTLFMFSSNASIIAEHEDTIKKVVQHAVKTYHEETSNNKQDSSEEVGAEDISTGVMTTAADFEAAAQEGVEIAANKTKTPTKKLACTREVVSWFSTAIRRNGAADQCEKDTLMDLHFPPFLRRHHDELSTSSITPCVAQACRKMLTEVWTDTNKEKMDCIIITSSNSSYVLKDRVGEIMEQFNICVIGADVAETGAEAGAETGAEAGGKTIDVKVVAEAAVQATLNALKDKEASGALPIETSGAEVASGALRVGTSTGKSM